MARGRPPRLSVYQRLDTQIEELWTRMGGLPTPIEAQDIWTNIWFEEAHHSTAIEGNTLVRSEVEKLLREGKAVGSKQLREYLEVQGYAEASEWVYQQAIQPGRWKPGEIIALAEVREIHHLAMTSVWDVSPPAAATGEERPGAWRRHEIEAFGSGWQPPTWPLIDAEMGEWIGLANGLQAREHEFPTRLAEVHCRFEQIHPFLDGNGRTGRLVLNLILVRLGYPPAIIYKSDRETYLKHLRRCDAGDPGSLAEFLCRAVLANLHRFVVPAVAGPARVVPLAALASPDISSAALRGAASRGALQAMKGPDGQWRSSRNWVNDYLRTPYRRTEAD